MKKSGVALLATIISIAVLLLVSGGFFTIMASNTGLIKSGGESLQAQYFAQLEADTIKMLSYDEVDNITQDTWQEFDIDNSWQYKVNVGPEQNVGDSDNTMKIASISVRKNGDTINRFALDVPLSSQSNNMGFPDWNNCIYTGKWGPGSFDISIEVPKDSFLLCTTSSYSNAYILYINNIWAGGCGGYGRESFGTYVKTGDVIRLVHSGDKYGIGCISLYGFRQYASQGNNIDKMQYPDWENGIELSPNIPHVIEKNGWIHWQLISSNTNNKNIILFINGKLISWVTAYEAATYYSDDTAFIPVTKGDIVYSQGSPAHFTFYPCR